MSSSSRSISGLSQLQRYQKIIQSYLSTALWQDRYYYLLVQTSERHNDLVGAASSRGYMHLGPMCTRADYDNTTITTTSNQLSRLVTYFSGQSDRSLVGGWLSRKKLWYGTHLKWIPIMSGPITSTNPNAFTPSLLCTIGLMGGTYAGLHSVKVACWASLSRREYISWL